MDLVDFHLGLLVDIDIEGHFVGIGSFALNNVDLGVLVTFIVEIFLGEDLGTVDDVTREAHTPHHTQFGFHILALGLLDAVVVDTGDAGTHAEVDTEVDLATHDGVGSNGHFREESVAPVALHGLGNLRARNVDLLPDGESGESSEHIVFVALDTVYGNASNLAGAGRAGIGDVGVDNLILGKDA